MSYALRVMAAVLFLIALLVALGTFGSTKHDAFVDGGLLLWVASTLVGGFVVRG